MKPYQIDRTGRCARIDFLCRINWLCCIWQQSGSEPPAHDVAYNHKQFFGQFNRDKRRDDSYGDRKQEAK